MVRVTGPPQSSRARGRRVMTLLPYLAGLFALSALVLLVVGSLLRD
jgi:hypothetical protein